jgi:hypothetical protein
MAQSGRWVRGGLRSVGTARQRSRSVRPRGSSSRASWPPTARGSWPRRAGGSSNAVPSTPAPSTRGTPGARSRSGRPRLRRRRRRRAPRRPGAGADRRRRSARGNARAWPRGSGGTPFHAPQARASSSASSRRPRPSTPHRVRRTGFTAPSPTAVVRDVPRNERIGLAVPLEGRRRGVGAPPRGALRRAQVLADHRAARESHADPESVAGSSHRSGHGFSTSRLWP